MRIDTSTPCAACPIQVRELYTAALVLVAHLGEQPQLLPNTLHEAEQALRLAVKHMQALVEAHQANQEHALSPWLESARAAHVEE